MDVFWGLIVLLVLLGTAILVFLLFTVSTRLGRKAGEWLSRARYPIFIASAALLFTALQGLQVMHRRRVRFHQTRSTPEAGALYFQASERFLAERNFYISLLGLIVCAGLLLIPWQIRSWQARNAALSSDLSKLRRD
jgi:4-amino-4-deoxy-L-arabinose transferase-like glycosyltransferase